VDGKDELDNYLLRFERYASVSKWEKAEWATTFLIIFSFLFLYIGFYLNRAMLIGRLDISHSI